MYSIEELELKIPADLRKIAIEFGIKDIRTATKAILITQILDQQQFANGGTKPVELINPFPEKEDDKEPRQRKRIIKPAEEIAENPKAAPKTKASSKALPKFDPSTPPMMDVPQEEEDTFVPMPRTMPSIRKLKKIQKLLSSKPVWRS